MNNLSIIEHKGEYGIDSREVADMIGKRHDHLIRDIKNYCETLDNSETPILGSHKFFIPSYYTVDGNSKSYPCYILTKKGCDMVANKMTGEKGILFTATYVAKFEEMETKLKRFPVADSYMIENPVERAQKWIEEYKERKMLEEKVKQLEPAAEFGNTIGNSKGTVLIRDYAKVLANDGIRIKQKELFEWLNKNRYIYRDKKSNDWLPYKPYIDQGLFKVTERTYSTNNSGDKIGYTTRITGKGQRYFYEKLKYPA